jgi:hypothetical protein
VRFADEGGHQRDRQQRDQPGRVHQQAGREADHRDHVLRLAEQLAHQVHPAHGLAPGAVQLVLQIGVLEVLQIQRGRVFHQADAGGIGEQLGEHRVGIAHQPAEQVGGDRQPELGQQQPQQMVELASLPGALQRVEAHAGADQAHRLVDDQLAHVQGDDGQQRAHQAQAEAGEGERATRRPDLAQERRQVLQRAEAFFQAGVLARAGAGAGCGGVGRSDGHGAIVREGREVAPHVGMGLQKQLSGRPAVDPSLLGSWGGSEQARTYRVEGGRRNLRTQARIVDQAASTSR